MRPVARIAAGGLLLLCLAAGLPAYAQTTGPAVVVGPIRQIVSSEGRATVYVGNQGDTPLKVKSQGLAYSGGEWKDVDYIDLTPSHFTIPPQRTVSVAAVFTKLPNTLCSVYGAGFTFVVTKADGTGLNVNGQGIAQLVVHKTGATIGDCVAVIPNYVPPTTTAVGQSWLSTWRLAIGGAIIIGLGALIYTLWLAATKRRKRKPAPRRRSTSWD